MLTLLPTAGIHPALLYFDFRFFDNIFTWGGRLCAFYFDGTVEVRTGKQLRESRGKTCSKGLHVGVELMAAAEDFKPQYMVCISLLIFFVYSTA